MARIRTIKPEFFKSETISNDILSDFSRLLFIGLWTYADDEGRGVDNPRLIKAELFPLRDEIRSEMVQSGMVDLATLNLIKRYTVHGKYLFLVTNWSEHQNINRPRPSKLPGPTEQSKPPDQHVFSEASVNGHVHLSEETPQEREQGTGNREQGYLALARKFSDASVIEIRPADGVAKTSSERVRDELWDAVMAVCRIDTSAIPTSARSGYGKVVKELRALGANSGEVARRAVAFRVAWPEASLTPHALLKRWAEVEGVATQPRISGSELELQQWAGES